MTNWDALPINQQFTMDYLSDKTQANSSINAPGWSVGGGGNYLASSYTDIALDQSMIDGNGDLLFLHVITYSWWAAAGGTGLDLYCRTWDITAGALVSHAFCMRNYCNNGGMHNQLAGGVIWNFNNYINTNGARTIRFEGFANSYGANQANFDGNDRYNNTVCRI
jgi:hypothetical protein